MKTWLNAVTSIVIGPGLGRDETILETFDTVLNKIIEDKNLTLVGDADFLWFLSDSQNKQNLLQKVK